MTSTTIERDPALTVAYLAVCVAGGVIVVVAWFVFGLRAMFGAGLGVLVALSNLWVLEKLVALYLKARGGRWAAIATVKAALLLGVVAVLVKSGTVGLLPITAGFGALPIGILIAGLVPRPASEEN